MGNPKKGFEATRAERKAKKRKLEDAIPDIPGDNDVVGEAISPSTRKDKKDVKRRKRHDMQQDAIEGLITNDHIKNIKQGDGQAGLELGGEGEAVSAQDEKDVRSDKTRTQHVNANPSKPEKGGSKEELGHIGDLSEQSAPRKSKKERKAERRGKEAAEKAVVPLDPITQPAEEIKGATDHVASNTPKSRKNNRNREKRREGKGANATEKPGGKDSRFIVFIGNLPFSATTESVKKHFASVKPKAVRHLTQKDNPSKSKGIAFVEFDGYDHMKTCLKLFHHSNFDDGISPPRKINVELTAGGGGNTSERRLKIKEKNSKLNDERSRRIQEEEKAKWEKRKEAGADDESAIHPSRRARVPGA